MSALPESLGLQCGDCGGRSAIPGAEAKGLIADVYAFLRQHSGSSYDVSLVIPRQRTSSENDLSA